MIIIQEIGYFSNKMKKSSVNISFSNLILISLSEEKDKHQVRNKYKRLSLAVTIYY